MRCLVLVLCLFALVTLPPQASARTWHILPDGTGDAPTIQAGIDSAATGDTVLVACGTYYEDEVRILSKTGLTLRSETGDPSCVTIDGEQSGYVFTLRDVDSTSNVEGFTITRGDGLSWGGMKCEWSSPLITHCAFLNNRGEDAGAIFCVGGSPRITHCLFQGNWARINGTGGVRSQGGSLYLAHCTFAADSSISEGGALSCWGDASLVVEDCFFSDNVAISGCAIACGSSCDVLISNSSFVCNHPIAAHVRGGAIMTYGALTLSHCSFWGNYAGPFGRGNAIHCLWGPLTISHCTFHDNGLRSTPSWPATLYLEGPAFLENTILAFNQDRPVRCEGGGSAILTCCDVYGNMGGDWVGCIAGQDGINGNFSLDPMFCDPGAGDLRLHCQSPCAPAQQPDCGLIGALDVGCGPTAAVPTTWGLVKGLFRLPGH